MLSTLWFATLRCLLSKCYLNPHILFCFRGNSVKDAASKAYAQVFAPHHGWAIRKTVCARMYALPSKSQLLKKLNEDGEYVFVSRTLIYLSLVYTCYYIELPCQESNS